MLNAALIVSFPSNDRERLFTTANTPVSDRENITLVRLSSTQTHLRNHFNHTSVWSEKESTGESAMTAKCFSVKGQYSSEVICTFRRTLKTQEKPRRFLLSSNGRNPPIQFIFCVWADKGNKSVITFICTKRKTLHVTHCEKNLKKWILN